MNQKEQGTFIVDRDDAILITGGAGFIGSAVVENLLRRGFTNLRCFTRSSTGAARLAGLASQAPGSRVEILQGNLLSREDCQAAVKGAAVVLHLAAGRGEKLVPD